MITGLPSKMKDKLSQLTRVFTILLICFVVTSPLNNSYEIAAMMKGTLAASASTLGVPAWTASLTPVYIKALKDIFILLSALLLAVGCIKSPKSGRIFLTGPFIPVNLFLIVFTLSALYSLTFLPAEIVLIGVRAYWSIILVYVGAFYCRFKEDDIYPFVVGVFSLQILLQAIQFVTDVGFNVYFDHRSPGLFIIPSTAGAFALLVHYFSIKFNSSALRIGSAISLWLSNSTTGLLILIVYYIYAYRNRVKPKILFYPIYLVAVVAAGYLLISNLGEVTGRGEGASFSALTRLSLIYVAFSHWQSLVFGQGTGIATAQAFISGYSNAVIADNTYLGILYNAGVVPVLLMLVFVVGSFRYFENKLLYLVLLGYSMTTVIFEINPVVQITLILLGAHIGRKYAGTPAALRTRRSNPIPAPS